MGLAFFGETGARIADEAGTAPIIGHPGIGRAYFPRDQSAQRVHFVRDRGGVPFDKCMMTGSASTNLINNPRFESGTTGWTNVTRVPYGGMWGSGGCGRFTDQNEASADMDAYYTYNRGSALGSDRFFFGLWIRSVVTAGGDIEEAQFSIKLRMQDTAGTPTTVKNQSYTKIKATDGWVWCSLGAYNQTWTGNILWVGIEVKVDVGADSPYLFIDGAILCAATGDADFPAAVPYHDGSMTGSAWSGGADASTSTVAAIRHAQYPITDIPYSPREGYMSIFCFPADSPDRDTDYDAAPGGIASYGVVATIGIDNSFHPLLSLAPKSSGTNGWTVTGFVGGGSNSFNLDNWPRCCYHLVISWSTSSVVVGVKGYFDPVAYGLSDNIHVAATESEWVHVLDDDGTGKLYIGSNGTIAFNGFVSDFCLGNRGLAQDEVEGILKHGAGPYSGTVAWAPLDTNQTLLLVDCVSFHAGGPLAIQEGGYSPQSGLVASSSGGRPSGQLTRTSTENVIDEVAVVGRQNDIQRMHRAIDDASRVFDLAHRNNIGGSRFQSGVVWAMDPVQKGHATLYNFPAPLPLRSKLFWGNVNLEPRLASVYGRRGNIWSSIRFERWGFWQAPLQKLLLAKNNTSTPASTFAVVNHNSASSTTDSNYFEVPEGLAEGSLLGPCLVYLRDPPSSTADRVRLAKRARGIPEDATTIFEAESANNTFGDGGSGSNQADTTRSGDSVRQWATVADAGGGDWIEFEIVNSDTAIPQWIYGEWRALVPIKVTDAATASFDFKAKVKLGTSFAGTYSDAVTVAVPNNSAWRIIDLGIFRLPPIDPSLFLENVAGGSHGISFVFNITNNSGGTRTIQCDCLMLFPADEMYCQVDRNASGAAVGAGGIAISSLGGRETAGILDASDRLEDLAILRTGGVYLSPGGPNRFWIAVDTYSAGDSEYQNDGESGATVELHHVPRHLLLPSYTLGGGGGWR